MTRLFQNALVWDGQNFRPADMRVSDRIVEVGELRPEAGEEVYPCDGAYLLPGLWDSHLHLLLLARALGQVDLTDCVDRQDLLSRLAQAEGEWVEGHGWNENNWEDPRLPSLDELDQACAGRPCCLERSDLHSALVNRAALERAGIDADTADPQGGRIYRDEEGQPTGLLADQAQLFIERVLALPQPARLERLLRQACAQLHAWGIVGVCDQRLKDLDAGPLAWKTYSDLKLPLRIHCNRGAREDLTTGPRFGEGDEWLRCGHVKFFSDGSMGSHTARMLDPYLGTAGERGLWITTPTELRSGFANAHQNGYPVSVHAIGDEAIRVVLELLPGHLLDRIEHLQILHPADVPCLSAYSPVASMQPLHLLDDRRQAELLLGPRASGYYRLASVHAQGMRLSFGSDAPVASADPWLGIQAACLRRRDAEDISWYPEECLDRRTALYAYTEGACLSLGWKDAGRLAPGYLADFCLVDRNPMTCEWPAQTRVLTTVVGGRTQFSA